MESPSIAGGNCLIGVRDELWEMQDDFSLIRSVRGYAAIGSGSEYALAATEALKDRLKVPKTLLSEVMSITSLYCPTVGSQSTIINT